MSLLSWLSGSGNARTSTSTGTAPSQYEQALTQRSLNSWRDFINEFSRAQDTMINLTSNVDERRNRSLMDASATAMEKSGFGSRNMSDAVAAGRPANSGPMMRDTMLRADVFRQGLGAAAGATEPALYEMRNRGRLKAAAIGRDLSDSSSLAMGELARDATQNAIVNAQTRMSERNAWLNGGFGMAGMYAATKYKI